MTRITLCAVLITLCTVTAQAASPKDFAGTYACSGKGSSGEPYVAILEILPLTHVIALRWSFPEGGETFGVGFVHNGELDVASALGPVAGTIVRYQRKGKALHGVWAVVGKDQTMTEDCKPAPQNLVPIHPPRRAPAPGISAEEHPHPL